MRRGWALAILLMMGLGFSCDTHAAEEKAEPFWECPEKATFCFDKREPDVLAALGGRAKRDDQSLILQFTDAPAKTLTNCLGRNRTGDFGQAIGQTCLRHTLAAHWPQRHAYLVRQMGDEFEQFVWIDDRTGKSVVLDGEPQFSPDDTYFFVCGNWDINSYISYALYRTTPDGPVVEWRDGAGVNARRGDAVVKRWAKSEIELEYTPPEVYGQERRLHRGLLAQSGRTWTLSFPSP